VSRYRFDAFVLSPARRVLVSTDGEVPLVPRYFDLLLFLLVNRDRALHRREIFDAVWSDVVVSDGALSQAVRSLRRALGDDPREPRFIRTLARHGYQFVCPGVREEADEGPVGDASRVPSGPQSESDGDPFAPALHDLTRGRDVETRRQAAETLHSLGTEEALRRLDGLPGHAEGRALMRDARWDSPVAGPVPLMGASDGWAAAGVLVGMRLELAARAAAARWLSAAMGGAIAGLVGGLVGGLLLRASPGAHVGGHLLAVFALIGAAIGGLGATGVGAGLAAAEALVRSSRGLALVTLGALGGGAVGALAHAMARWTLKGLFGHDLFALGGGLEGLSIGAAAGLGYALGAPRPGGGMAAPRGRARLGVALATAVSCAVVAVALTRAGGRLGGVSLDAVARSFEASQAGLAPLARLFGEQELGPVTRRFLAAYEGGLFGFGLALGLTRRPPAPRETA
jgi:DNA-binding winged helix-turn-helix (wHTH) protein